MLLPCLPELPKSLLRFVFAAILLFAFSPGFAEEKHLHPATKAIDYEARYTDMPHRQADPLSFHMVRHRAGWFREDRDGQRPNERDQYYYALGHFPNVTVTSNTEGMPFSMRVASQFNPEKRVEEAVPTGVQASRLGNACQFWRIIQRRIDVQDDGFLHFACFSLDGIVLLEKSPTYKDNKFYLSSELRSLKKHPLSQEGVLPPPSLFDIAYWTSPLRKGLLQSGNQAVDFEMTMRGKGLTVIRRRHFPWNYEETRYDKGMRSIRAWNESEAQGWSLEITASGKPSVLFISRRSREDGRYVQSFDLVIRPAKTDKRGMIVGEACHWFDMASGIEDAGQLQCLTSDGIPLAIKHTSHWGDDVEYIATRVTRREVSMNEFYPPQEFMDRQSWGFPAQDDGR